MSSQTFGKYLVTRRLSRGSIAEVFEARDPALDRKVAVKVIHAHLAAAPGFNERFRQEAERLARLRHPAIVQLHDFGISDEQPYLVMEYLEGGCLRDLLARRQAEGHPLSPVEAAEMATRLAEALDYAHRRGVIHGDVRPSNILLTEAGEPVLSDFGVARLVAESAQGGTMLGASPTYMSPQQAAGGPADPAGDVYALAVVLYEMTAGRPPFAGASPVAIMMQQLHDTPPAPRQFATGLAEAAESVLLRALAKDPAARFPNARSMMQAFTLAAGGGNETAADIAPRDASAGSGAQPVAAAPDFGKQNSTEANQPFGAQGVPGSEPRVTAGAEHVPSATPPRAAEPGGTAQGAAAQAGAPAADRGEIPAGGSTPSWLSHLTGAAEVTGALIGRQAPVAGAPGDRRGLLAAVFGAVGILLAALQFIVQVFELVDRSLAPVVNLMPYVIALLLVGAAGLSIYVLRRTRSPSYRQRATVTLAITLLIGLAWGGWTAYNRLRPVTGFLIAVGEFEFDGEKAPRIDFARRISEEIKTELAGAGDDVSVQRTLEVYPDSETARARGAERKASLVIWGWYDDGGVKPQVEALRLPSLQRETVAVPLLVGRAHAATPAAARAAPRDLKLADVATFVHTPVSMPDYELFVKNGPQQMAKVAEAVLGMVYYANGRPEQALAMFEKALTQGEGDEAVIAGQEILHFQRSTVLYQQRRLGEAQAALERAVELKPDLYEARHNLAIVYSETCAPARQIERAISEAEAAVRLRPGSAEAHRLLGNLYEQAGRSEEAVTQLETARDAAPQDALVLNSLATAYRSGSNDRQAELVAAQALALRQGNPAGVPADPVQTHLDLGDAYMGAGKYAEALAEYEQVQRSAPDDGRAYRGLGNAYYWLQQPDQAAEQYRLWIELSPKDPSAHLLLGMLLNEQGRGAEAVAELEQAARLAGCSAAEHLVLGGVYWEQDDLAGAVTEYGRAAEIEPADADTRYVMGSLLLQQYTASQSPDPALLPQATASLSTAVRLRPIFPEAFFALGHAYAEQKMWSDAAQAWETTVRQQPGDAANHVALADAYEKLGRLDDAVAAYRKALDLKDDAAVRTFLGMVFEKQGKDEEALAEYRRVTEIDSLNTLAYSGLAGILARLNRPAEAVDAYRAALAVQDDPYLRAALAATLAGTGKIDDAVAEYERSLAVLPTNWTALMGVAPLYRLQRRPAKAEDAYRATLQANPQLAGAQFNLASLAYQRCSLSEAAQAASAAIVLDLKSDIYRVALAGIQAAQGKTAEVEQLYAGLAGRPAADAIAHLLVGDYLLSPRTVATDTRRLDQAAAEYRLVIETPGTQPFLVALAQAGLGQVYYQQDRLGPAEAAFEAALAALPMHAGAQAALGDIAARRGDREAALAAYDRAGSLLLGYGVALSADAAVLLPAGLDLRRGLALSALGRGAEAQAALDRALAAALEVSRDLPQWTQAQVTLAAVYLARAETGQADAALSAAAECDASLAGVGDLLRSDLDKLR